MNFLFLKIKQNLFILLFVFCFVNNFAQKKYPSLLWEITGNGLTKPSYLYGTMHVSSKLAFHLSDSFFVALSSVNSVGLESNPDQWLSNMKTIGLLEQFNNPNTFENANFYKDAFKIEPTSNKRYMEIIANDPDIINNLLYRNNNNKNDHEESTYIDLYIYKVGSKLNKKIVSLEDFNTSLIMATKSSVKDPDEDYDETRVKYDYYKVQDQIDDSYRLGDLDALDSLTRLVHFTKNTQKYLIEDRNVILAHNIDSVSKTGSVFSGIGAAHLPGEAGVIELLRKMGYKLRPMSNIASKRGIKQKEKIDDIVKKLSVTKQYAADSLFTFDLHEAPVSLANLKGYSFVLTTDMANGSYYTISRQATYASLFNYNSDKLILKIDSLLYESIPGKIISKKEIIASNGIRGIDIINKTKRSDLQRYQIYFTENEIIIFKMSGKGDYINGTEAARFFESIKFIPKKSESLQVFSPATKGFSVNIPSTYKYINNKKTGYQGLAEELFAQDKNTGICYGVMNYYYHDFYYLEEDTFELNILCNSTLKNFGYEAEITREITREQNLSCINFSGLNKKLNKTFYGKLFIKGSHYYLAFALVDVNQSNKKPQDFFNSFKIIDFKHINELKTITDDNYAFTATDELVPEDKNLFEEGMASFYADIENKKNKKLISTAYNFESKSKSYYSPSSGEHINIEYEKYNDYDYRDSKTFWDDINKYLKSNYTYIISKPIYSKNDKTETYEMVLKDTATSNMIKRKYILKDGLLFCLSAVCDSSTGTTGWADGFLKSFKHKDTLLSQPIFENKTATLLKDLNSTDTTIKYAARQTLENNIIDKKFSKQIIDFIKSNDFLKLNEDNKATLLVNVGDMGDEKIIPVYKDLYNYFEDSSYLQICIIKGLGLLKTKASYNTLFELLKNKTPLTGNEENISNVLSPLNDSLELCANFFPDLLSLTSFEEYKTPINNLFADLVIRNIIPSTKYQVNLPVLIAEANNELKRYNTSAIKAGKSYAEEELGENLIDYYTLQSSEIDSVRGKKIYPSYFNMIENHAVILAPFYNSNVAVKKYFEKLFKIKDEQILLNIYLIANNNKIPLNDTVWRYFSKNKSTLLKTYIELSKMKMLDKFDKSLLSQEDFCKTKIENSIIYEEVDNSENSIVKEKEKPDSVFYFRKEPVINNREEGVIYFYDRVDSKTKTKSLAYAYVKKQKVEKITTQFDILSLKRVIEKGKTAEDVIKEIKAEFYYKTRLRYVLDSNASE